MAGNYMGRAPKVDQIFFDPETREFQIGEHYRITLPEAGSVGGAPDAGLEARVAELEAEVLGMENVTMELNTQVMALQTQMTAVNGAVAALQTQVGELQASVASLDSRVTTLETVPPARA